MVADVSAAARRKMIEGQLVPANILDEDVIAALAGLPRELFVPEALAGSAYVDEEIEIAEGRYLISPLLLARLLVLAEVKSTNRVLDIGGGTGYSTAVLAQLAEHVVAVEEDTELAARARSLFSRLHLPNTEVVTGGLGFGHASGAPYDLIFLNGSVEVIPQALTEQLAEGGRIVGVRYLRHLPGTRAGLGKATLWRKLNDKLQSHVVFDAFLPPLKDFQQKQEFVF